MNSVIISDYGVMLAKTGERLVVRKPAFLAHLGRDRAQLNH